MVAMFEVESICEDSESINVEIATVTPLRRHFIYAHDLAASGEDRVFGLECLAADPVVQHLAEGAMPSLDTVYRDLRRFRQPEVDALEAVMAEHGMAAVAGGRGHIHVDIDTTVEPLFGSQQGALPGPNPRYHGRPGYHPVLGLVAETGTCIGACLRPGNTGFGEGDVAVVAGWLARVRQHVGPKKLMTIRMDAVLVPVWQHVPRFVGAHSSTHGRMETPGFRGAR